MSMYYHTFGEAESYSIALLMKASAFDKHSLSENYVKPLARMGIHAPDILAYTLSYDAKKVSVKHAKEYLDDLLPTLKELGVKHIYCTDANYFKLLVKEAKAEPHVGYVMQCKIKGYEHMSVVLGVNYQQLVFNPDLQSKLDNTLHALVSYIKGAYQPPGQGIIHKAVYPKTIEDIKTALEGLMEFPELSADIEAYSLRFNEAGIATIAFAVDKHRGIAFPCDYKENSVDPVTATKGTQFGQYVVNPEVRALLKWFFTNYKGRIIWHNAGYDVKVIIYSLWMENLLDTRGLLDGLAIMTERMDDTKIIAYLATNSTAGNTLGLKHLAQEFAGNWAVEEIKDVRLIPLPQLLQYNLVDALSTMYVKEKYYPIMVKDQQEELYLGLMLQSQRLITQIELTGMPMNKAKILEIEGKLQEISNEATVRVMAHPKIAEYEEWKTDQKWEKDYQRRKANAKNPDKIQYKDRAEFKQHEFNPGSAQQLQTLLYEMMGFPIIDLTDTRQPATGEKTLAKLLDHPVGQANKELIEDLIKISQVSTILSTFIPAFKRAIEKAPDGIVWLHGSFNIGGTVSGRLSSSDPNLQNIPAKSIFAKLIKECFMAPTGWLFAGADFNSLEDMISALTTKDPNKLKVYTDGFDGHSLRAAYYFQEDLEAEGIFIDLNDPKSVNQLKKLPDSGKEHPTRQWSKAPTFLLTYGGTYHGMMKNLGWSEEKSKPIEANYHKLYVVSDQYVADKLKQANKDGYVTVAFGLRVRTPLIQQVLWHGPKMPREAAAEGRTAGNALGQSYGLLNNRAAVDFWIKVWNSKYRYDILPVALIHDAIYMILKDDPEVVEWANRELIKSMQWQELPEIQHESVKLGAALDIFWPNWSNSITLPNNADQATIIKVCKEGMAEYLKPKEK
jgi:DNA polymerase-1